MSESVKLNYAVSGSEFSMAGEASVDVKSRLKMMGAPADTVRRAVIALYEAEINLVIHGGGGTIDVEITPNEIRMIIKDEGPGIPDLSLAMSEGFSTATEEIRNLGFGAGMGLPNMRRYTDGFDIESELGKGTTIRMMVKTA